MAGHSKWANIKHRKERADQKKGKLFSRLTKELIRAVKAGGSDPKSNAQLRVAIEKAKKAGLGKETIERNCKKASDTDSANYTEMLYEMYGHEGVGILVQALTDNKNRTASFLRIATNKKGGSLGSSGSVAYNFDHKGIVYVPKQGVEEEDLFLLAFHHGAEDFIVESADYMIIVAPEQLYTMKQALQDKGISSDFVLEYIPKTTISCSDDAVCANKELLEFLEDIEDVDSVYHNMQL